MSTLFFSLAISVSMYVACCFLIQNVNSKNHPSTTPLDDLPDILETLSLCVEAGMDLFQAMTRLLPYRGPDPLSEELRLVEQEVRAGATRLEAWRRLAERVPQEELRLFVALVVQSETLGTGLGRSLRSMAEGMRERRFRIAEKRALEAPVKLMVPMACVFIAVFLLVGGALYLDMTAGWL